MEIIALKLKLRSLLYLILTSVSLCQICLSICVRSVYLSYYGQSIYRYKLAENVFIFDHDSILFIYIIVLEEFN